MIVGEAHIIVRAITRDVDKDIKSAFNKAGVTAGAAGEAVAEEFSKGFNKNGSPLSNMMDSLSTSTEAARRAFDAMIVSSYTLGPLLAQLVGGVSALVGALGALAGMAAGAVPSLAALGGAFVGLIQAGGVLKLAFSGVTEAIQAGTKAKKADAAASKAAKKDLTSYIRAVKDARRALNRVIEDNYDRIYEATKKVMEAEDALVRTEKENANAIAEAKRKVEVAQLSLNAAYAEGYEQLQQLNFDAEDAALAEKRAALELEKARETLLRVQDLPPNSRQRREAELAYAQADLNYRKAIDANKDMAAAADKANAAGVDGTDAVVDARNDLADATEELAKREQKAQEDRIDGYAKIMEAQDDLYQTELDNAERLADAQRNLKRAQEDLARARKAGAAAGVAADTAYKNAMADLSKEQQDFVRFMVNDFIPAIKDLKAAAAEEFFPKLTTAMSTIKDRLFPEIQKLLPATGGILGDAAIGIANVLTSDKALGQITKIWKTNDGLIERFGNIAKSVLEIVLRLLVAIGPITQRFVKWLDDSAERLSKFFNKDKSLGELQDFFDKSANIMAKFGDIFGSLFSGLGNIIVGLMEPGSGGHMLLDWFIDITQKFEDFTKSADGKNRIAEYFKNVAENAIAIAEATAPFLGILARMGEDKSIKDFADTIKGAAPFVENIVTKFQDAGPALADFIVKAAEFFDLTTDSGAIKTFWETLTGIVSTLVDLFKNPVIQEGFKTFATLAAVLVALRTAWTVLKIPILAIANPLVTVFGWFSKLAPIFGPLIGDLGAFFSLFASEGFAAFQLLPAAFASIASPVAAVAAVIAGLVLIFVAMWRESETFRKAIKDLIDGVLTKAKQVFETLKKKLDEALKPLGGMSGVVDKLKVAFKWLGDMVGKYVIPFFEGGLKNALDIVGAVFGTIIDTVGNVISAIMGIIDAVKAGDWGGVFTNVVNLIIAPFKAILTNLVDLVKNIFNNMVTAVKKVLGIASPSKVFMDIAQAVLDGFINIMTFFPKKFLEIFTKALSIVTTWWANTGSKFFSELPGKVFNLVKTLWDFWWKPISIAWDKVKSWWATIAVPWFTGLAATVLRLGGKVFDFLSTSITNAWKTVQDTWKTITSTVSGWVTAFKLGFSGLWDGLFAGLKSTWSSIKAWWNANVKGKGFEVGGFGPVPKWTFKIPGLALGGVVSPTPGGTLVRVAEAGRPERVEPLDKDGLSKRDRAMISLLAGPGGGATFNIYPSPGMDERELAKLINRELAFQMRMSG